MDKIKVLTGRFLSVFSAGKSGKIQKEAQLLEQNRKYLEAIDKYLELLELNPGAKEIYLRLGALYEGFEKIRESLEMYSSALSLDVHYGEPLERIKKLVKKHPDIKISTEFFEKLFVKIIAVKQKKLLLSLLATIHYAKKNYTGAIEHWEILLELCPSHPEALKNLSKIYCETGRDDENYEKILEELFRKNPKDKDTCMRLAGLYRKKGAKDPEALNIFLKAYELDSEWKENTIALAKDPPLKIHPEKLRGIYEKALTLAVDDGEIYCNLGVLLGKLKNFDSAEEYLKKAVEQGGKGENGCRPRFELAMLYIKYGFKEKAEETFKEILSLYPDNPETLTELKKILWKPSRRKNLSMKDLEILNRAFHLQPDIRNYNMLAEEYLKHREIDKAIELYNASIELKPQKNLVEKLIELYKDKKYWPRLIQALDLLMEFSKKKEQKIELLIRQAAIYQDKLGDREKAKEKLEKILKIDSTNIEVHKKLFHINYVNEKYENIHENFSGLIDCNPLSAEVYCLLSDVLAGQGKDEQSLYASQIALLLDPTRKETFEVEKKRNFDYPLTLDKRLPVGSEEKFETLLVHQSDRELSRLFDWTKAVLEQFYTYEIDKDILLNCIQITGTEKDGGKKAIYRIIEYCCKILLTEMPKVYVYRGKGDFEVNISKDKEKNPFIIINHDFMDKASLPEKYFIAGRNISYLKRDNVIYKQFGRDLPVLMADFIITTVVTTIPVPIPGSLSSKLKEIPLDKILKQLKDSALPSYFQEWSKKVLKEKNMEGVIEKMLRGLDITADRCGLICCSHAGAAATALLKGRQRLWDKPPDTKEIRGIIEKDRDLQERLIHLWKFALLPEFLEIFQKD